MHHTTEIPPIPEEYNTREKCLQYLCDIKWGKGYSCRDCGHKVSIKGKTWYYRRCQACGWDESCTSHTMFHKLKFPIDLAFALVYQLSSSRKGMSCNHISKHYQMNLVTAWLFRAKVQLAMSETRPKSFKHYMNHCVKDNHAGARKSMTLRLECKSKGKRQAKISEIRTNISVGPDRKWGKERWSAMRGKNYKIRKSKKCMEIDLKFLNSDRRPETQMYILNMRNWISGVHHFVSMAYLERYIGEFQFRYLWRDYAPGECAAELLCRMVNFRWKTYRRAKAN